jgi:hypothetical protein
MPPSVRFFAGFTSSLAFRYSVIFIVRLQWNADNGWTERLVDFTDAALEDTPEITIGAVETVLGTEAYQPFQGH